MRTGQYLPGRQSQDRELQLKETGRSIAPKELAVLDFKGCTKDVTNHLLPQHKIRDTEYGRSHEFECRQTWVVNEDSFVQHLEARKIITGPQRAQAPPSTQVAIVLFELGHRRRRLAWLPAWLAFDEAAGILWGPLGSVLPDRDSIVDTQGGVSLIEDATTRSS
jgi:hypothetical protein